MKKSEFGKGFTYCLGLFLAHSERDVIKEEYGPSLWFSGARDHLREIVIPEYLHDTTKEKIKKLLYLSFEKEQAHEDVETAVSLTKEILYDYDIECGIKAIRGEWE